MRRFQYIDPTEIGDFTTTVSEEWIEKMYYPHWSDKMKKAGKEGTLEHCIEDFVMIHWAVEL